MSALLAARVAEARAAYPDLALEPAAFVRHLAQRLDARDEAIDALSLVRFPQLYLACACAAGDERALQELERAFLPRVPSLIARLDRSAALADEVTQAVRAQLLVAPAGGVPGIAGYSGRGELIGFIRVVALRTAQRLRRLQRRTTSPAESSESDLLGPADPERDYLKVRYREAFEDAFRDALGALAPRERLFLRLHYLDGLNIAKIGAMYRLHRATVARRIAEHRRRVLELTRARLRERLRLSDSECDSMLALLRSQLAVSLRGALAGGGSSYLAEATRKT